jgi:hypothetical protein
MSVSSVLFSNWFAFTVGVTTLIAGAVLKSVRVRRSTVQPRLRRDAALMLMCFGTTLTVNALAQLLRGQKPGNSDLVVIGLVGSVATFVFAVRVMVHAQAARRSRVTVPDAPWPPAINSPSRPPRL